MNGHLTSFLIWVASGLVGLAGVLFGVVLKMHAGKDDERYTSVLKELDSLRSRMHDAENAVSRNETRQRWQDEDDKK